MRRYAWFALYSVALLALMSGPIRLLISFALDFRNQNASHILLIPFISIALIYYNRAAIFRDVRYAPLAGCAVALLGLAVYVSSLMWGTSLQTGDRLAWTTASIVTVWLGGFLLVFGAAAFRKALFPLLFLFFCAPIPGPILNGTIAILQRGSAEVSYILLKLTGMPVYRLTVFEFLLPDLPINIAPECSGIRSGISLLILTLLAGHLMLRSMWRWVVLMVVALPVLFFKNGLRIATLSFLGVYVDERILTSSLHQEGGIPFFGLGLLLMYPVLSILVKSEKKSYDKKPVTREP
jgi:exosortase